MISKTYAKRINIFELLLFGAAMALAQTAT
jgi:hypothetical protein